MNKQTYDVIGETLYTEQLDNGLSVFLLPRSEMNKTYAIFATNYGSIDQTFKPINEDELVTVPEGVAHFLEHKMFEKADRDVFTDFGKQGASANAFTSFTTTAYLFSATSQIDQNVETLVDFVQDPYFSEQSVEKEKGIIAQEINMYNDQPDWQLFVGAIRGMFSHHPVKVDIAGTVESIQQITKDDLYTCYNTFYHPENMRLFIAGDFDPEQMMVQIKQNQAKKKFQPLEKLIRDYPDEASAVAKSETTIHMPVSIPKCAVGIKESSMPLQGAAFLHKELLQEMVLDHFYAHSGDFYQELYEHDLIDTSFFYETSLEKNFGFSLIGGNTSKPDEFAEKVKDQLYRTNEIELGEHDCEQMKKKKVGQLLRAMNSLEFIAGQSIQYDAVGVDFFQVIEKIQSLTTNDINTFVKQWIDEERLTVCRIMAE